MNLEWTRWELSAYEHILAAPVLWIGFQSTRSQLSATAVAFILCRVSLPEQMQEVGLLYAGAVV